MASKSLSILESPPQCIPSSASATCPPLIWAMGRKAAGTPICRRQAMSQPNAPPVVPDVRHCVSSPSKTKKDAFGSQDVGLEKWILSTSLVKTEVDF